METIKVNMNPNPLDVQTIHASQNDGEARQWGFELHNNGDVIDSSEITDQMVFKAYKGGTEEILPTNGSTPTTSPFKGDIKYPQGLLTDQEFLYRQSPTEEDGNAKIKSLYGNTLVWNQLASVVGEQTAETGLFNADVYIYSGHKYLVSVEGTQLSGNLFFNIFYNDGTNKSYQSVATSSGRHTFIFNCVYTAHGGSTNTQGNFWFYAYNVSSWKNLMFFDLTAMGIDSLTDAEILQWFADYYPLPYYDFNAGTLLSFNGTGVKTVGKNQVANVVRGYFSAGQSAINVDNDSESFVFYAIKGKTYVSSSAVTLDRYVIARCDSSNLVHGSPIYDVVKTSRTWTATWTGWAVWYVYSSRNETVENSAQVEFGTTATAYEPYTSHTTNLPIATYFPTGMKSAGNVYDELTPRKAITRIGAVDLGSLDWTLSSPTTHIFRGKLTGTNAKIPNTNDLPNALLANYQPLAYNPISANDNGYFALGYRASDEVNVLVIIDSNYSTQESFISHISGQYLFYELATPTETSFTTASLVTENAEIPLSNEDGVLIGKCTEQLSENPGFIDAKIKLSDSDGTCYSNKLQLHVERSPQ